MIKNPKIGTRFAVDEESSFAVVVTPPVSPVRGVRARENSLTDGLLFKEDGNMPVEALLEPRSGFEELEELIEKEVRLRTCGRVRGLQVRVQEGQVMITGRTATYYAKQLVTHAALDNAEQLYVINDIEVG